MLGESCSTWEICQHDKFSVSFIEGQTLAANASAYISEKGSRNKLYTSYFGSTNTQTVIDNFDTVANENDSSHTCVPYITTYLCGDSRLT